jgi:hypothetical protein
MSPAVYPDPHLLNGSSENSLLDGCLESLFFFSINVTIASIVQPISQQYLFQCVLT